MKTSTKSPTGLIFDPENDTAYSKEVLPGSVPSKLLPFQGDVYGNGAIVRAVHEALDGKNVTLVGCIRSDALDYRVRKVVSFGLGCVDGSPCVRYTGEGGKPNGAGSHSVICSGQVDTLDPAALCATIARHFSESDAVFLSKNNLPSSW